MRFFCACFTVSLAPSPRARLGDDGSATSARVYGVNSALAKGIETREIGARATPA